MGRHLIVGFALLFLLSEIAQFVLCGRCVDSEKQALLKFKASFHDDPYELLSSWNPKTNCCQWDGIACDNFTGHVLKLDLSFYWLEANGVDPSLLELQHLIYLDLSANNFNAISIPAFFGSMERLRYLSIHAANFTGNIPTNFGGNLTDLQFLDLSGNDLHTNDMSWASQLQSLQYLNLSSVYLGEAHNLFQVLQMLPSLLQLQLESCGLGNLSTPLPPINFTNNATVQLLNLAFNEIDGRILHAFQNWTSVEFLNLRYNNFSSLPLWFGEFKNLISLDLSDNTLCGPIPIALRNLTMLQDLYLSNNNFSAVPSWLGELRRLRHLYIMMNKNIATMEISVSQILNNMCHLKILSFEYSNLQGKAFGDSDFRRCIEYGIEELSLPGNELNGHLPTWVGHLEKLNTLDLSSNYFSGNIPQSLGQLVNLTYLHLSNNSFNGNIPQIICHLENLNKLDLSFNNFSGEIPNCWRDNQPLGLIEINLSFNKLSGAFPISIGKLSSLLWLHLNNNYLEGKLPSTLKNSKRLLILDLGENKFFGSIPSWTNKTFSILTILRLRNNMLDGKILSTLCQLNHSKYWTSQITT